MNKNRKVLVGDYIDSKGKFSRIIDIIDIDYAPLIIKNLYERDSITVDDLNEWFQRRGIPQDRDDLNKLENRLHFSTNLEILNMANGLSLSDHYWLKHYDSKVKYEDISFFNHDFNVDDFLNATFKDEFRSFSMFDALKTPNNTTNGKLKKAWITSDNQRYLLKGSYQDNILEPFHDVLASKICERLKFSCVPYTLEVIDNNIVSKCPSFIDESTEFISAREILSGKYNIVDKDSAYLEYATQLRIHNISKAKQKLENMFILDYIMLNKNRNLDNFGIIRDVNTLKWIDVAPLFGHGTSLSLNNPFIESNKAILFYDTVDFKELPKILKRSGRIKLGTLNGIPELYRGLLRKYQSITGITDEIITREYDTLNRQISMLKAKVRQKK